MHLASPKKAKKREKPCNRYGKKTVFLKQWGENKNNLNL
jgi:hypothetical protein